MVGYRVLEVGYLDAKISPIRTIFCDNYIKIEDENQFSIDEKMIGYKGIKAENLQYRPKKLKKLRFNLFGRTVVSGVVYDFLVHTGSGTFDGIPFTAVKYLFALGFKVVLYLSRSIQNPQDSMV